MTRTRVTWAAVIVSGAALVGCKETVSSCDIRTSGLAELTTVTSNDGAMSTIHTNLVVGGDESNTYANLDCGDQIFAEVNGTDRQTMRSVASGEFEAEFDTAAEDDDFNVILERGQDDNAPDSRGTMPAPFAITSTFDATPHSRATEIVTIEWDPSGETDTVNIVVEGNCIFRKDYSNVNDDGAHDIPAGDLEGTNDDNPDQATCPLDVTVTRERQGSADSVFDAESWFVLRQIRTTGFTSAP